jgi:SAM-dependent methyltransferase
MHQHSSQPKGESRFRRPPPRPVALAAELDDVADVELREAFVERKVAEPDTVELEVRFGHQGYPISARLFHAIKLDVVQHFAAVATLERSRITSYKGHVRLVELLDDSGETVERKHELKRELQAEDGDEESDVSPYLSKAYPYKVALSEERPAKDSELPSQQDAPRPTRITERWRSSYLLYSRVYAEGEMVKKGKKRPVTRVDCTFATIREHGKPLREEYRIELEVLDATVGTAELRETYMTPLLQFVLESPILVSLAALEAIRSSPPFEYEYEHLLQNGVCVPRKEKIRVDKPEDLTLYQLSSVGRGDEKVFGTTRYAVTIKTDGIRKLLFIFRDSLYLVGVHGTRYGFSRIYRKPGAMLPMQGTLIDGELLESYGTLRDEKTGEDVAMSFYDPKAAYDYWAFDVLAYPVLRRARRACATGIGEGEDVEVLAISTEEGTPFMAPQDGESSAEATDETATRLGVLKVLCQAIRGPRLSVTCKHFERCDGPERFFDACRSALDASHLPEGVYPFETDGLVFTPMDLPYVSAEPAARGDGRRYVSYSRKWKPVGQLTNDLLYQGGKLWIADYDNLVPFTGSERFPWNGRFETALPDGTEIEEGQIVEFAYLAPDEPIGREEGSREPAADEERRRLVPVRPRPDKERPSALKPASDVWQLLNDPIHESTLRGASYQRMRRSQNEDKANLIAEIPEHSRDLDLGAGQGGDQRKWLQRRLRVVALEPDPKQRARFTDRLAALGASVPKGAITLLEYGGEDARVRDLGSFDTATLFFVITFFRGKTLDALIDNLASVLRPGGKVYLTGFDARRFASYLPGYGDALDAVGGDVKKLELEYVSESTYFSLKGHRVALHLSGTLVGTREEPQQEYAVDYDDVVLRMEARGFHVDEDAFLTEETFLSRDELRYARSTRLLRLTKGALPAAGATQDLPATEADLDLPSPPPVNEFRLSGEMTSEHEELQAVYDGDLLEEGLLPLLEDLAVDAKVDFEYLGYALTRIGALGDGNCLIHAICRAVSDKYKEMKPAARIKFARDLRREMADDLEEPLFDDLGNGAVKAEYGKMGRFKAFLRSNRWLGEEFLDLFERTFQVEIIMLWFTEDHGMIPGIGKALASTYEHAVIVLNLGNAHYETVGFRKGNDLWTLFSANHRLIKTIKKSAAELPAIAAAKRAMTASLSAAQQTKSPPKAVAPPKKAATTLKERTLP